MAAVHAVTGLLLIGRASLWGDEAFTAETVRLPLHELLPMLTRIDVNMSAYYLVTKAWTVPFGDSETAIRSWSLLCTTGTVVVGGLVAAHWFGERSGVVAAAFLGLNPLLLLVGITARPFAMLALLTTLGLGAYIRALGSRRLEPWLLVAVLDVLALYTSLLAVLLVTTQGLLVVALLRRVGVEHLIAALVVVGGAVPAVMFLAPSDTLNWLTRPTLRQLGEIVWQAGGQLFAVVLLVAACVGLARRPPVQESAVEAASGGRSGWVLPAFVMVPVLLMLALLPVQSLFTPPYLVGVVVSASLLAGAAVGSLPRRWTGPWLLAVLSLALVAFWTGPAHSPALDEQDWRGLMRSLLSQAEPGDSVVFPNTYYRIAGEHYARSSQAITRLDPRLPAVPWFSHPPDTYDRLKRTGRYADGSGVLSGLTGVTRVWLVGPDDSLRDVFTTILNEGGWTTGPTIRAPGLSATRLESPGLR